MGAALPPAARVQGGAPTAAATGQQRAGRRFLFLSPNLPYPPDSGGNQRSFLIHQALSRLGRVDFLLVGDVQVPDTLLPLLRERFNYLGRIDRDFGTFAPQLWSFRSARVNGMVQKLVQLVLRRRLTLFRSPRMQAALQGWLDQGGYEAVVTRYLATACQTGALRSQAVYVDVDDLDSEVWHSRAAAARHPLLAWVARSVARSYARAERALIARCAGAWVTKASDLQRLGGNRLQLAKNIPFAAYPDGIAALPPGSRTTLLGVGLYDWLPNRQGFDWFVREVWPRVHRARPDCALHLVGKLSDAALRQRWSQTPGVHFLGRVEDLQAAYQTALFTVAPIFSGGGTNIKVIESLAYGRSCVVTPHAVKGFEEMPGLHLAQDAAAFAQQCIALLDQPGATLAQGAAASQVANGSFSFAQFAGAIALAIEPAQAAQRQR